jgi:ubiquinone/menaquinone biosynthesis C-methylase UbiE
MLRSGIEAHFSQALGDECHASILEDYPWHDQLRTGSESDTKTVIDCGGGYGDLAISLAQKW